MIVSIAIDKFPFKIIYLQIPYGSLTLLIKTTLLTAFSWSRVNSKLIRNLIAIMTRVIYQSEQKSSLVSDDPTQSQIMADLHHHLFTIGKIMV